VSAASAALCTGILGSLQHALMLAAWALAFAAHAGTEATVIATHPHAEAELGRGEPFYVRIAFNTDEPVNIWARPYFMGQKVTRITSNASSRRNGTGEALGWFALNERDEVDEVRIIAGGGNPWHEWMLASHTVRLTGTGAPAAPRPMPEWVAVLQAQEAQFMREETQQRQSRPVAAGEVLWFSGFMLTVLALLVAGLAWPAWALWKWRGGWRLTAAVPCLMMGFVVLRIVFDTARDPTSHNLWPLEILMFGTGSLAIMAVLSVARRLLRPQQ
jgi:hypothetical protein